MSMSHFKHAESGAEQRTEAGPEDHSVNHFVLLKPRYQRSSLPPNNGF